MKKDDCIFCKLANGEIPTNALYEDDIVKVIFDANPAAKGHVLILPKEHFRNVFDLDENYTKEALVVAQKIAGAMKEVLNCDGLNILQNNEEVAGQTVFHFHIHLIPRYKNDGVKLTWIPGELDKTSAEAIANNIRERIV